MAYEIGPVKVYEQDGNRSVGVYFDGKVFTAMSWSVSKDFKTFKAADAWLQKFL